MLRTERLVLRPLDPMLDAESLHEAYTDTETMEWWHLPLSSSIDETARRIADLQTAAAQFAICTSDDGAAVGHAGWLSAPAGGRGAFGYLLRRDHWGRGIAHEAASAALDHGFSQLGVASAELWVYEGNRRSAALAERLGCSVRGRFFAFNLARGRAFPTLVYGVDAPGHEPPARVVGLIPSFDVADVSATTSFWTDMLGFEIEFSVGEPPTLVSLRRGEWAPLQASIRFRAGGAVDHPPIAGSLEVMAVDIDQLHDELCERGAPITEPLETKPWAMREFAVTDPNGIRVRFYAPALATE